MQEIFKKIIEKLEEEREYAYANFNDYVEECSPCLDAEYGDLFHRGLERAVKVIKEIVKEYNNGWIPVNEDNLPKNRENVLILWGGGNRSIAYYVHGGAGGWFFNYGYDYHGNIEVPYEPYAWQPLPKLYMPKGE